MYVCMYACYYVQKVNYAYMFRIHACMLYVQYAQNACMYTMHVHDGWIDVLQVLGVKPSAVGGSERKKVERSSALPQAKYNVER